MTRFWRDYSARIEKVREFALLNRVLLVRDRHGIPVDISLSAMPFEERTISRASAFDLGSGHTITTCSATDLVVHKAFAARARDWVDIKGILTRSGDNVDWKTVFDELTPLAELKEEPEILNTLRSIHQQID